jgi:superfamily II DNA or RNA helicase
VTKDQIQEEARNSWLEGSRKSTIVLGTGGGKSKVAIDLINALGVKHVLILVNSTTLKETSWPEEIRKYHKPSITRDHTVHVETYQTAYKYQTVLADLIIYDEVDFAADTEYATVFDLPSTYKLGLTGFIPQHKADFFKRVLPVCYTKTAQELQEAGVLNRSEIILIRYPLSLTKDIKVMKRDRKSFFYNSENDYYKYYNEQLQKAQITLSKTKKDHQIHLLTESGDNDMRDFNSTEKVRKAEFTVRIMVAKRKKILNSLNSSVKVVHEVVNRIHSKPGNKVIVFSGTTDQCDRFGYPTYYGKKTSTEKDLSRINSGEIDRLAVCKAIDRGVNLNKVNYLVKESFDGSEVSFHQTHGRLLRLEENQVAKYILLLPTFIDKNKELKDTQQAKWIESMLHSFNADTREITIGGDLKLDEGIIL